MTTRDSSPFEKDAEMDEEGRGLRLTKEKDSERTERKGHRGRIERTEHSHVRLFRSEYKGMFTDLCVLERSGCWVPVELLPAVAFGMNTRFNFGCVVSLSQAPAMRPQYLI